jgi:hypothetical protein
MNVNDKPGVGTGAPLANGVAVAFEGVAVTFAVSVGAAVGTAVAVGVAFCGVLVDDTA